MSSEPDVCPFCLEYEGMAAARDEGARYCPSCGADWQAIEGGPPRRKPTGELPELAAFIDGIEAKPRPSGVAPMTIGLLLGLVGTLGVALVMQSLSEPTPSPESRPVAVPSAPATSAPATEAPKVVESAAPALPSPPESSRRRVEAVEQAIARLVPTLPSAALVALTVKVTDDIAYLQGRVDGAATLAAVSKVVGGVFGIKAVDTRQVRFVYREHVVRNGDSLVSLARKYYGRGDRWRELWKANPQLKDPRSLDLGWVVRIPNDLPQP